MGILSIKDHYADCQHARAPLCILLPFLKVPVILKIDSEVLL